MLDTELVEPGGPLVELGAIGAAEREVVEADPELAEPFRGRGLRVLVQPDECAVAEQVNGVMEVGIGVLVEDGVGPEDAPGTTERSPTDHER